MEILIPILIVLVLVFGFGVVAVNRVRSRRRGIDIEPPARPVERSATARRPPCSSPRPAGRGGPRGRSRDRRGAGAVEVEIELAPGSRSSSGPASATAWPRPGPRFAGGVHRRALARAGITDDTWDDLEEALLRADVGVGVTTELLDGLRAG